MTRRYAILFAAVVVAAGAISLLGRMPRQPDVTTASVEAAPHTAVHLTLEHGEVTPARAEVERGHVVDLVVVNRGDRPARLTLSGYEDRLDLELAGGGQAGVAFLADRPGDDFAWLVDGVPAGRFAVAGSHLVEGHR